MSKDESKAAGVRSRTFVSALANEEHVKGAEVLPPAETSLKTHPRSTTNISIRIVFSLIVLQQSHKLGQEAILSPLSQRS